MQGPQNGRAADAEMQALLAPDTPNRSGVGIPTALGVDPVGARCGKLLVDPLPRQGGPVARRAVQTEFFLVPPHGSGVGLSLRQYDGQGRPYDGLDDQTARSATAAPVCGASHIMPLPA
jgi:hypothetical protein